MIAHLEVAVALYGPFWFSNESCPISPILWLCIQENITLLKPIEIILPHFLSDLDEKDIQNFGVHFAKADHKQYIIDVSGRKYYTFKPLETAFIAYKEGSQNYGILSTWHCCFLCIKYNHPRISPAIALKAEYLLWCIEEHLPQHGRDTLHFCITFCNKTCVQVSVHVYKQ